MGAKEFVMIKRGLGDYQLGRSNLLGNGRGVGASLAFDASSATKRLGDRPRSSERGSETGTSYTSLLTFGVAVGKASSGIASGMGKTSKVFAPFALPTSAR